MSAEKKPLRRLSFEFSRDVYKDEMKIYLLPAKIMLQSMCSWPDNDKFYTIFITWFCFINLVVAEIFHAAYVVANMYDIGDAVGAGATVTTTMEALLRLYILITKREIINDILVKVWKQFWTLNVILDPKRRAQLKLKCQIAFGLTCSFLFFSATSNTQITSAPFLKYHNLILRSVFPFEWNQTYVYELLYIWQYYCDWLVLFMVNAFDFLVIPLIMICAVQFRIMQEVFRNILQEDSRKHRIIIFGERGKHLSDRDTLFECLEHHKLLIGICNQLEDSFNMPILVQFFASTSAICAASLILKVDTAQFLKMLMYAAAHVTQLFYYCFVGQELTFESGNLSDAIYECNWHLSYNREIRKAIVLMIQRSQRVQCLTAAGITELDFTSFLKIMRLSFSFYTLLNNLLIKSQ